KIKGRQDCPKWFIFRIVSSLVYNCIKSFFLGKQKYAKSRSFKKKSNKKGLPKCSPATLSIWNW
ncbi:hypothetical protein, partial [Bacteroides sp.]|uniref:hypothetical protein n=1 Tax=Bacteroides sp. TaxID=29523 RepID=UPI003AAD3E25